MIVFKKVRDAWGWLSNMSPHPIQVGLTTYPTAEHWFQCMRFPDGVERQYIVETKSPMGAKMAAKGMKDKMVIEPRSRPDLNNMYCVLREKMWQYPRLREELLTCVKDGELIVEDVSARPNGSGLFWGMAQNPDGSWTGQNWLGKLWMEVRTELKRA